MGNPPPPDDPLEIEELRFGSWAGPGAGPVPPPGPGDGWRPSGAVPPLDQGGWEMSGPPGDEPTRWERVVAWIRAHRRALAAATGIAVVLAFAITVIADPGGEPAASPATTTITPAPSTTEPRPVSTRPATTTTTDGPSLGGTGTGAEATDWRMVFDEVPGGYELGGAQLLNSGDLTVWPSGLVFAPSDARWMTGPWVTVMSSPRASSIEQYIWFNRPPAQITIGPWAAVVGSGPTGNEQIVLQNETTTVVVIARGVDQAELVALVSGSSFDGSTANVPVGALPAGFAAVDSSDLTLWMAGWAPGARSYLSVLSDDGTTFANVFARPATEGAGTAGLGFFVELLAYVTIGGGSGVAGLGMLSGTDNPSFVVTWRHGDRELVAIGSAEMGLDGIVDLASSVVTPDDPGWRDDDWRQAQRDAADCCRFDPPTSEPMHTVSAVGAPADSTWVLQFSADERYGTWLFQSGADALDVRGSLTGPALDVGSTVSPAFQRNTYHAAAVALLDRSQVGAVLRLTTTGSAPQTVEVPLQPVPDSTLLTPYVVAGAVLPWVDGGFVAELVAPDGTTILTRTDADLG